MIRLIKDKSKAIRRNPILTRNLLLWLFDFCMYVIIATLVLLLHDDARYPLGSHILPITVLMACVFFFRWVFRVYLQVWRYASAHEYMTAIWADFIGGVAYLIIGHLIVRWHAGILIWQMVTIVAVNCLTLLSSRFVYLCFHNEMKRSLYAGTAPSGRGKRFLIALKSCISPVFVSLPFAWKRGGKPAEAVDNAAESAMSGEDVSQSAANNKINIAIVGAGDLGVLLARELLSNPRAHYYPYCFVDSDRQKVGNMIAGIRVYPEQGILERLRIMPVQEVIIALPQLSGQKKKDIYEYYQQSDCKVKLYDYPFSHEENKDGKRVLREFSIEELLAREEIQFSDLECKHAYQGKTILVTGGGGSIGSELCRQLVKLEPETLVIFDIYENNAYEIEQELLSKSLSTKIRAEIGSVRDENRLREIFETYRPHIVFHAAAHKHVPLMEKNSAEAIKNNVFGTLNTVNLAEEYRVERFLLISTDKAVNPTNVMGASKRLCEMIVQSRHQSHTLFSAVRFGNVLGSNGSVITLFKKQISAGGPVTLTDRRIIRYFMTIPEAAQLVLRTCALSQPGDIYVLDMGVPVKILSLAEHMIRLSGLLPYKDIEIKEVGLRPGEKLYEELLISKDCVTKTKNDLIFVEHEQPISQEEVEEKLAVIRSGMALGTPEAILSALHQAVPTYENPDTVNKKAENAPEMKLSRRAGKLTSKNVSGW